MIQKIEYQEDKIQSLRLSNLHNTKKVNILQEKGAMHQRVLMSLTEKAVPRLRQLVSVCIRQKRSISYIMEKVNKAMHGLYSPKGYTEFDHDVCSFV